MFGPDTSPCLETLFRPSWSCLSTGSKVTLVVDNLVWSANAGVGRVVPGNEVVRLSGLIPHEALGVTCVTVVGAVYLAQGTLVDLELDETCAVLCHTPMLYDRLFNLVELCAGAVLSSVGLKRAGFKPCCSVEVQPKLAALHQQIHEHVPVVCADICDDVVAYKVFQHCPNPGLVMSGIACQPYSRGGLQHGEEDERAGTLPATLRLTHFLQSPALIIECVAPAQSNSFVQKHVAALSQQLGYKVVQCTLKLEDVWSAFRYRWWVLATHPAIGEVKIPGFPSPSPLTVRDLMPYVRRWPDDEEAQLILTEHEMERFGLAGHAIRSYAVKPDSKLPTALHSWGGQTQPCACDCRPQGFSDSLLQSKGLYAQLVQMPATADSPGAWKHLHVAEVALLNAVPLDLQWGKDQRLNLCAIGQMAAPMQSMWIGTSLARHLQQLFTHDSPIEHMQVLNALKREMFGFAKELYPAIQPSLQTSEPKKLLIHQPGEADWWLPHSPEAVVQDLSAAVCKLHGLSNEHVHIRHATGEIIRPDVQLASLESVVIDTVCEADGLPPADASDHSSPPSVSICCCLDVDVLPTQPDVPDVCMSPVEVDTCPALPVSVSPVLFAQESLVHNQDEMLRAILSLQPQHLVQQVPPLVMDFDLCNVMRQPTVTVQMRHAVLASQQHVWADDEIFWHLKMLHANCSHPVAILDPLITTTCLRTNQLSLLRTWYDHVGSPAKVASVVLHDGHWTPCLWILRDDHVEVLLWEHAEVDVNPLNPLHGLMCAMFGRTGFQLVTTRRQFGMNHCGAAAIAFLKYALYAHALPSSDQDLQQVADSLRLDFQLAHFDVDLVPRPWCWGAGTIDVVGIMANLLHQHGVPTNAAAARAKLLIQGVGMEPIKQAVQGTAPWKTIKGLANQQQPPFQLVLPDELAAVAHERSQKNPKKTKKAKGHFRPSTQATVDLDPARLTLAEDTFKLGDGTPAKQLALSQVGPLATGVALVSFQDALPFLQAGTKLTHHGLALLVVNGPDELQTNLIWTSLRFATTCTVNKQPVLLSGFLVQLGETMIEPYFMSGSSAVGDVPVACARLTVFADQWPQNWSLFADHPFKQMLNTLLPIQTCRDTDCQCERWHPNDQSPVTEALLDVFKRQFFTDAGRPTKPQNASHFSVQVRYLKCQEHALLKLSGQHGLYVEPRTPDASVPSEEYQVVWLPQASFSAAQHQSQCEPMSVGLARSGNRYGIRIPSAHFQQVFQKLKPEGLFLAPGTRQSWLCGPWPYGSDRKSIAKVFQGWPWQARPIQPAKAITGGVLWLVQSVVDPPQTVYNLPHGQVMISKCDSAKEGTTESGSVVGPQSTVELCATSSTADPWLTKDPWQQALSKVPTHAVPNAVPRVAPNWQEMEDRVTKSILQQLPQDRMEVDDTSDRLHLLESQMQQMVSRQQTLEGTVMEHHKQNTVQVQSLQAQMMSHMEAQGAQIARMFDDQMSKLEGILSKKTRFE